MSFAYRRAADLAEAVAAGGPGAAFLAGGTDLLPLWKLGVATPDRVIDISRLPLDAVTSHAGGMTLGALARMSDVADHPQVHPLVAQALLASASAQVRNAATIGGNLLQRTRCAYFRSPDLPCAKRQPGSGCGARLGENRPHAIFGGSEACVATHPSDLAVALVALDAQVRMLGPGGERAVAVEALYRSPGDTPERDTVLSPGEIILAVEVPAWAGPSGYLKVRDRAAFEFAVVSVAVALRIADGRVVEARIAAGGVGTRPWRLRTCEAALAGAPVTEAAFAQAAARAGEGATPLSQNGFKIALLERTVLRALKNVGGGA